MTATRTKTHYATIFAKAFPGERTDHQRCSVDHDGTVRVYDDCAGYYTTCHELSETDQDTLRARAKQ